MHIEKIAESYFHPQHPYFSEKS